MRVPFSGVFSRNADGSYTPRGTVQIGGVTMGPGVSFTPGVSFSGVDVAQYADHDLDVEQRADGAMVINGVYQ